jgi:hypothetical protein
VDPRAILDAVVKRKIPNPPPGIEPSNPDRPACNPALYGLNYHNSYTRRWEDNIEMVFTEIVCEDMNCTPLTWDRIQWLAVINVLKRFNRFSKS